MSPRPGEPFAPVAAIDLQPIGGDLAQTLLNLARSTEAESDAERFRVLARRYMPLDGVASS